MSKPLPNGSSKRDIQVIPYPNNGGLSPDGPAPRIETGAVQFGEDWPGLFIRGDNAMGIALHIDTISAFLNAIPDQLKVELGGLQLAMAVSSLKSIRNTIMTDVVNMEPKNEDGN